MRTRRVLALLALPALTIMLASCAEQVPGSASPAAGIRTRAGSGETRPPLSSTDPARSALPVALTGLEGVWEGTYTCNQGNTGMRLIVKPPRSGSLPAVVEFFPLPENPGVKSGSYTLRGSVVDGRLVLRAQRWIDRPEGYVMVDFVATVVSKQRMSGTVRGANCTTFSVNHE